MPIIHSHESPSSAAAAATSESIRRGISTQQGIERHSADMEAAERRAQMEQLEISEALRAQQREEDYRKAQSELTAQRESHFSRLRERTAGAAYGPEQYPGQQLVHAEVSRIQEAAARIRDPKARSIYLGAAAEDLATRVDSMHREDWIKSVELNLAAGAGEAMGMGGEGSEAGPAMDAIGDLLDGVRSGDIDLEDARQREMKLRESAAERIAYVRRREEMIKELDTLAVHLQQLPLPGDLGRDLARQVWVVEAGLMAGAYEVEDASGLIVDMFGRRPQQDTANPFAGRDLSRGAGGQVGSEAAQEAAPPPQEAAAPAPPAGTRSWAELKKPDRDQVAEAIADRLDAGGVGDIREVFDALDIDFTTLTEKDAKIIFGTARVLLDRRKGRGRKKPPVTERAGRALGQMRDKWDAETDADLKARGVGPYAPQ